MLVNITGSAIAALLTVTPTALAQSSAPPSLRGSVAGQPGTQVPRMQPPNPVMPTLPPIGEDLAAKHRLTALLSQRTTNFNHASSTQGKNMAVLAKRLNGVIVAPGATFSYYRTVGPYTAENGFYWGRAFSGDRIVPSMGGGVCQGASTLYSTLMRTDLKVVERHQHSLTVPYLPPGEDATVAGTYLDFKFKNDRATPVMIAASADLGRRYLTVALWGKEPSPPIRVKHEVLATYPYKTISHCVSNGTESEVKSPGQPGVKVKTWVYTKTEQGEIERYLGVDTYKPSPRIVEKVCGMSSGTRD